MCHQLATLLSQEGLVDIFIGTRQVYTVHAPAWLGNPLHVLELKDTYTSRSRATPPLDILQQIAQRARDLGVARSHNSLARLSHHFSMVHASSDPSIHAAQSAEHASMAASQNFELPGLNWGVRGCTARASRGCRVWKVPRWVLEVIAAEDPTFAPTLAQCIVDSFDRDVQEIAAKTLDHCSMPAQEEAAEQVPDEHGDPAAPTANEDDGSESEDEKQVNGAV